MIGVERILLIKHIPLINIVQINIGVDGVVDDFIIDEIKQVKYNVKRVFPLISVQLRHFSIQKLA